MTRDVQLEIAFLRSIQADPDNALTLRIYADYLEEIGDAESLRLRKKAGHSRPGRPMYSVLRRLLCLLSDVQRRELSAWLDGTPDSTWRGVPTVEQLQGHVDRYAGYDLDRRQQAFDQAAAILTR